MIYLDYAASTPVDKKVLDLYYDTVLKYYANPNSSHKLGIEARNLIDDSTNNIASILGVLSGTSGNAISVGKACLLGANSVTGIPLGDNCIVDAGIAVLEGTKFLLKDREELAKLNPYFDFSKEIYKGIELKGLNGLHFRQDSISGAMIVSLNKKAIKLNEALH